MTWFNNKENKKLETLLKQSQGNFSFNQADIKSRLLQSIAHQEQTSPKYAFPWYLPKYATALAAIVLFVSGAFAFASNSQPGDKLFAVTKVSEQIILSLPLPETQLSQLETKMVSRRLKALDNINKENSILETVKESDEGLNQAVEKIILEKARLEKRGKSIQVEKLDQTLTKLEALAGEHEQKFENLKERATDQQQKERITQHLEKFKQSRHKALQEIKKRSPNSGTEVKNKNKLEFNLPNTWTTLQ